MTSSPPSRVAPVAAPPGLPNGDLWVFGYGSLMWKPGFEALDRRSARLFGYHRDLCIWSWVHRGTRERPGLVLGLDRGGSCVGVAYRVAAAAKSSVMRYLYDRELVTNVYLPAVVAVRLDGGRHVRALAFVVDRDHEQYAGRLSADEAAATVRGAQGRGGHNVDYVLNTHHSLVRLGLSCPRLGAVCDRIRR